MTTPAPQSAKSFAIASPMPIEAPVTTATLPVSSIASFYLSSTSRSSFTFAAKPRGYNERACPIRAESALTTGDPLAALIPLFPLDVVLFPGVPLPLHIFEPRYKEMIGECLAQHRHFGVVRAVDQGLARIGCTAEIITVVKEYSDGRLDLATEGRKRFELLRVNQERSFLQAAVLIIDDNSGTASREVSARAIELHSELVSIAGAEQDLSAADPEALSFYLAGS